MRFILGFLSMLAVGLVAAVVVVVGMSGSPTPTGFGGDAGGVFHLDYPSLLLGLALGLVIATLSWVSWSELPRRFVSWVLFNERSLFRYAAAGICLAVLLFY